jgi:hypothetical protein
MRCFGMSWIARDVHRSQPRVSRARLQCSCCASFNPLRTKPIEAAPPGNRVANRRANAPAADGATFAR